MGKKQEKKDVREKENREPRRKKGETQRETEREKSVPRAQRDPRSGTPRDAGAEFSTRMSAGDSRSTKTGSC